MDIATRLATPDDAFELVRLRAIMFESMGVPEIDPSWRLECRTHLADRLGTGEIVGAVVESSDGSQLASSGLAEIAVRIPSPTNRGGLSAYLSSFSTEPGWRRPWMARLVLGLLLGHLEEAGVRRVELHAAADGLPLYAAYGFVPRVGGREMRLDFYPAPRGESHVPSPL